VLRVEGKVRARPAESLNERLATGAIEVLASGITVLNEVRGNLPFPVSVHDEENTREELRLRHRYLDLRRERMARNLRLRHATVKAARGFLEGEGFIEVETPVLTRSTPEGARDYLVPSRVCGGEWFALPQSPQLFKQLLMVGGIERYYQVARCFRDEDLRADRQPEFTQLDMEMSFMDQEEILALNEGLIAAIWKQVKGIELPRPFPRLTWHEAMARYGTDRPDTRYGMELTDVSDLVASMGFKVFSGAVAAGGSVKCIAVAGGNEAVSNVRIKPGGDVFSEAQKAGAGGLAFIRVRAGGEIDTIGAIKDNLTAETKADLLQRTGAGEGTLLLFGAEYLVRGAVALARKLNISPMIIGMTIVAYGTTAPELVVSLEASINGQPGIAVGNVIGSNIANILLILGGLLLLVLGAELLVSGASTLALRARIPAAVVGVTVVPCSGLAQVTACCTSAAASTSALIPRSGSSPACAARPVISTMYQEVPLRASLRSPSIAASSTKTASACCAVSSMRSREVPDPISSSVVKRRPMPSSGAACSRAVAAMAWTTPTFMSKTPGPRSASPSWLHGIRSSVPIGHTVSRWPSRSTRGWRGPHCRTGRPR